MASNTTTLKKPAKTASANASGRSFSISMEGIPRVDAKAKSRLEAAARKIKPGSKKRNFPVLIIE